jgi:hypothetical protein
MPLRKTAIELTYPSQAYSITAISLIAAQLLENQSMRLHKVAPIAENLLSNSVQKDYEWCTRMNPIWFEQ